MSVRVRRAEVPICTVAWGLRCASSVTVSPHAKSGETSQRISLFIVSVASRLHLQLWRRRGGKSARARAPRPGGAALVRDVRRIRDLPHAGMEWVLQVDDESEIQKMAYTVLCIRSASAPGVGRLLKEAGWVGGRITRRSHVRSTK